nr:hypothetical protein [uncultured Pseudomonas sp.]
MTTLKSKLRGSLMSSRGQRKNTKNAIWLVYSLKSQGDLSLASNNECIYWAVDLEAERSVRAFQFDFIADIKFGGETGFKKREVVKVELTNGQVELHHLSAGDGGRVSEIVYLKEDLGVEDGVPARYVRIHTDYLRQNAQKAVRLLRVISFAAQIRDELFDLPSGALKLALKSIKAGPVEQLLSATDRHDPMIVLGLLCRRILEGTVSIDLDQRALGKRSYWRLT